MSITMAENKLDLIRLSLLEYQLKPVLRRSQKNVPHLIVSVKGVVHSIVYFSNTNTFSVFWPWPSYGLQDKKKCENPYDVVQYITAKLI